jgi:hypothetical protein
MSATLLLNIASISKFRNSQGALYEHFYLLGCAALHSDVYRHPEASIAFICKERYKFKTKWRQYSFPKRRTSSDYILHHRRHISLHFRNLFDLCQKWNSMVLTEFILDPQTTRNYVNKEKIISCFENDFLYQHDTKYAGREYVTISRDIAPCSPYVDRRFGGPYHLHLQDKKLT